MDLIQIFRVAFTSLNANKLRSLLTMLGIIIGVAAVIAMLSIGQGAQASIQAQIESVGSNLVYIRPGSTNQGGVASAAGSAATLTQDDADALVGLDGVLAVSPEVQGRAQVVYQGVNANTSALGVVPDWLTAHNSAISDGDFFTQTNLTGRSLVVVLGATVATELFGDTGSAIGQSIRVNGQPYKVLGVLVAKGGSGFGNQDDEILLPLTTMLTRLQSGNRFRGAASIGTITVAVDSPDNIQNVITNVTQILDDRHHVQPGSEDFTVQNQADALAAVTSVTNVLTIFLGGIASISLVVGGIGIMNIMLVSVTERTREIGIRMAIGARSSAVRTQFLIESIVLSLTGGIIGILLGLGISILIPQMLGWPTLVSFPAIIGSVIFSVAVGVFFGYYPARKAAGLDPIEALRFE